MACSNPLQIKKDTFKTPSRSHMPFEKLAKLRSLGELVGDKDTAEKFITEKRSLD